MPVRRPLRLRYSLYHSLVASVVVAWVRAVWASCCSCCSCCSMSCCTILFIMIRAFLAAGGERKKEICGDTPLPGKGLRPLHSCLTIRPRRTIKGDFSGTPHSPAKDSVLCTPVFEKES